MRKDQHTPASVVKGIDDEIAYHRQRIADLEFTRKMLIEMPPPPVTFFQRNPPMLTRDLIRRFMSEIKKPIRTVEVVDFFFPTATEKVKDKAIKTLSVIFNNLEKEGSISKERREGVKGNYYQWIQK